MTGSLTDVAGIEVGHATRRGDGWLTGVTAVLLPPGTVGGVDVRGGGPGTHETDALDPRTLVPTVDAVVLTGGSAYGLVAAHGVQRFCAERGRGFPVGPGPGEVVPIVPAAAVFDLGRGGVFGNHPTEAMGHEAAAAAHPGPVERGVVGAGTGAVVGGRWKGGVGSASARSGGVVVAALAVVNAVGLPVPGPAGPVEPGPLNTTLVVVATDAALDPAETSRTATVAHDGLARALNPVHTLADGDTAFAVATGAVTLPPERAARVRELVDLQRVAADVVRDAVLDAIAAAEDVGPYPRYPG
ncbi:L-aminopeptidase/D-esterase-like protein [Kineococcus radiotolerans]|uniref:L-aminopeptidase/D-esterase-like protein n=1 Tax=Kineococcus radiotolerans TaxID=131568 RepID=A0A7W4TPE9_KINRA|nr:P1 family peptidase [Kineococcus radiotolerans]MBB2902693.1 L-aminopeptidase/D-esterase-like protein [Kineococcus radiotolerans]